MEEKLVWELKTSQQPYALHGLYNMTDLVNDIEILRNEAYEHLEKLTTTLGFINTILLQLKKGQHVDFE